LIAAASFSIFIAAPVGANTEAAAEAPILGTVTVTGSTSAVNPTATVTLGGATWYKVETAGQFVYAATYSGDEDRRFLLMKNFLITGNGGYSCNQLTTISGAIYDGAEKTAYFCTITFSPTNDYNHRSSGTSGGLFANFAGKLYDMNFVFNGTLHALGSVNYGGFAGIMKGEIHDCNMASSGTVMLYGNSNDRVIYGGGLFGQLTGKVVGSTLT